DLRRRHARNERHGQAGLGKTVVERGIAKGVEECIIPVRKFLNVVVTLRVTRPPHAEREGYDLWCRGNNRCRLRRGAAMPLRLPCPHCQGVCTVRDEMLGRKVLCPRCQKVFQATPPPLADQEEPLDVLPVTSPLAESPGSENVQPPPCALPIA